MSTVVIMVEISVFKMPPLIVRYQTTVFKISSETGKSYFKHLAVYGMFLFFVFPKSGGWAVCRKLMPCA